MKLSLGWVDGRGDDGSPGSLKDILDVVIQAERYFIGVEARAPQFFLQRVFTSMNRII